MGTMTSRDYENMLAEIQSVVTKYLPDSKKLTMKDLQSIFRTALNYHKKSIPG